MAGNRSQQARKLALHLEERAELRSVDLLWMGGAEWNLCWSDGPTESGMLALVTDAVARREFSAMADRVFVCTRSVSARAWAATAAALRRDPEQRAAIAAYAAGWRSRHGNDYRFTSDPDEAALCHIVDEAIKTTERPDRVRAPEDEPLIEELLRLGRRMDRITNRLAPFADEYTMARLLVASDRAPEPTGDQPVLRVIPGGGES
jgi:hypothetical protein